VTIDLLDVPTPQSADDRTLRSSRGPRPPRVPVALFALTLSLTSIGLPGCASTPLPPPPTVSYETKVGWIIRLEDQRILSDPAAAAPPPPVVVSKRGKNAAPPPPLATPDLIKLLGDTDARIRRRAALGIGRVGLTAGVAPLGTSLNDPDADVRQMAAFALGLIADKSAVPALTQALTNDASLLVRGRAAEALSLIGDNSAAAAIGQLAAAQVTGGHVTGIQADDLTYPLAPEVEAFRLAIYALTRLKAYDPLAAAVLDPNGQPRLRWWPVAYALQRTGDKRALPALLTLVKGDGVTTSSFAARGLGSLKDPAAVDALIPLTLNKGLNLRVQVRVVAALGALGDARAVQPLLTLLDQPQLDPTLRLEVVKALGDLRAADATERLLDLMSDRSPAMRIAAFGALAKANPEQFIAVLSGLDPDPDWVVRAATATTLSSIDQPGVKETLRNMLNDGDQRAIPSVLRALVKVKLPKVEALLMERIAHEDPTIRATAISLLGEMKHAPATQALQAAWDAAQRDTSSSVREAIVDSLKALGPAAARDTLKKALADRDWALRLKAARYLKEIDPAAAADVDMAIRPAPTTVDAALYETLAAPKFSPHAFIDTRKGTIEIELAVLDAPLTSHNFVTLARKGFFNGLRIHRLVPDFVVQDGDPRGDGEGGPGYSIRDELNDLPYLRGTVGMALSGKDTGGSQYFLTISPQPHLDAGYTAFGRVVKGLEVLDQLQQYDTIDRVRVWDGVQMTAR
jgi:HEAT repeat protein/cyclophilin family peptidyl-prolyl cis-trans isomerase